ncbi:MAG: VOC family protein [Myxococcota bacterium]
MEDKVIWFEVMGQDGDSMQQFYNKMFGWQLNFDNPLRYSMLDGGNGAIPGGVGLHDRGSWATFYVRVQGIEERIQRAQEMGAQVILPIQTTPDGGKIAVVTDPEGHPIGMVQTAS